MPNFQFWLVQKDSQSTGIKTTVEIGSQGSLYIRATMVNKHIVAVIGSRDARTRGHGHGRRRRGTRNIAIFTGCLVCHWNLDFYDGIDREINIDIIKRRKLDFADWIERKIKIEIIIRNRERAGR